MSVSVSLPVSMYMRNIMLHVRSYGHEYRTSMFLDMIMFIFMAMLTNINKILNTEHRHIVDMDSVHVGVQVRVYVCVLICDRFRIGVPVCIAVSVLVHVHVWFNHIYSNKATFTVCFSVVNA
jgi:hypothetical protein